VAAHAFLDGSVLCDGATGPVKKSRRRPMNNDRLSAAAASLKALRSEMHKGMSASELAQLDEVIEVLESYSGQQVTPATAEAILALLGKLFDRLPVILALFELFKR
jgi:hypothetical protein